MVQRKQVFGDLPWGWWLRASGHVLEDEDGSEWRSVRDAFWQGRLGFPEIHIAPEQHELLLRVLTAIDHRWLDAAGNQYDLFEGDMFFWRFYMCWLVSIGMVAVSDASSTFKAPLSAEGRSVMLMLQATRDPEWQDLPISDVVDAMAASGRGEADVLRERALQTFECDVACRRHVFARECIGRSYLVTLTGIGTGIGARMPIRRVMWSQSFFDQYARDDLFAWLARRVDRWDDWGAMAYRNGADILTSHFLTIVVASGGLAY